MMGDSHDGDATQPGMPDPRPQNPFEFSDGEGAAEIAIKGNLDLLLDVSIPVSVVATVASISSSSGSWLLGSMMKMMPTAPCCFAFTALFLRLAWVVKSVSLNGLSGMFS